MRLCDPCIFGERKASTTSTCYGRQEISPLPSPRLIGRQWPWKVAYRWVVPWIVFVYRADPIVRLPKLQRQYRFSLLATREAWKCSAKYIINDAWCAPTTATRKGRSDVTQQTMLRENRPDIDFLHAFHFFLTSFDGVTGIYNSFLAYSWVLSSATAGNLALSNGVLLYH